MKNFKYLTIQKNRGWRGLAEVNIFGEGDKQLAGMVFSFSPRTWNDLLNGYIVVQDLEYYHVIEFDGRDRLPKPTQQRSVLIKDFKGEIKRVRSYKKSHWSGISDGKDYTLLVRFLKNKNNHTTSDWNQIGIRVMPSI